MPAGCQDQSALFGRTFYVSTFYVRIFFVGCSFGTRRTGLTSLTFLALKLRVRAKDETVVGLVEIA